ncbi:MAG: hypothetical protein WC579_03505 [Candidatus Paceibacterota bacterium]|jgi:hypothetical protein
MKEKTYGLTKQEANKISQIVGLLSLIQELFISVQLRYEYYIKKEVFKRLSIDEKYFEKTIINPNDGNLTVSFPDEKKK